MSAIFAFTPYGAMRADTLLQVARLVQMKLGIALRATAIAQLGRFRTPNVAVLADHRIVERGLYRHIRHPSYLGALLVFLGFSLALVNWLSLVVIMGIFAADLFQSHPRGGSCAYGCIRCRPAEHIVSVRSICSRVSGERDQRGEPSGSTDGKHPSGLARRFGRQCLCCHHVGDRRCRCTVRHG
ncbi:MAG: methyltransferase family protein [Metallibacterium sp.]